MNSVIDDYLDREIQEELICHNDYPPERWAWEAHKAIEDFIAVSMADFTHEERVAMCRALEISFKYSN